MGSRLDAKRARGIYLLNLSEVPWARALGAKNGLDGFGHGMGVSPSQAPFFAPCIVHLPT